MNKQFPFISDPDFLKKVLYARDMGRLGYVHHPSVEERYGFAQDELNAQPPSFDWTDVEELLRKLAEKGNGR